MGNWELYEQIELETTGMFKLETEGNSRDQHTNSSALRKTIIENKETAWKQPDQVDKHKN